MTHTDITLPLRGLMHIGLSKLNPEATTMVEDWLQRDIFNQLRDIEDLQQAIQNSPYKANTND